MTIKPKSGWSIYHEPWFRSAPEKPKKVMHFAESNTLFVKEVYDGDNIALSELIPKGMLSFEFETAKINIDWHGKVRLTGFTETIKEYPNEFYEKQLEQYKEDYKKYKKDKLLFAKELEDWKLWKKQEEKKAAEKEVKWAEKILKKHKKKP